MHRPLARRLAYSSRRVLPRIPADRDRTFRHLDDAKLDRLRDAVAAEARWRGRPDGKTSERGTRKRRAPVTPGLERLVLTTQTGT